MKQCSRGKPFTLIEMLAVIGVIAILAGLLLPALTQGRQRAKMAEAKTQMSALETAISQYESTYGTLPYGADPDDAPGNDRDNWIWDYSASTSMYYDLIGILSDRGSDGNARGIEFLSVKKVDAALKFKDPWNNNYHIAWDLYDASGNASPPPGDTPYDQQIWDGYVAGLLGPSDEYLHRSVVIWSMGPDGAEDTTDGSDANQDNIYIMKTIWSEGNGHELD